MKNTTSKRGTKYITARASNRTRMEARWDLCLVCNALFLIKRPQDMKFRPGLLWKNKRKRPWFICSASVLLSRLMEACTNRSPVTSDNVL